MERLRRCVFAGLLLGSLLATSGAAGATYSTSGLIVASSASPFAACTVGGGPTPETNYPNSELEPFVDVNPTDPDNIVGVYQQDRWSTGGAHGLVAAVSHDGGQTWDHTWAHFSTCSGGTAANGGNYDRASDPWLSFAPNGDLYQISLSASGDLLTSAILVSKSTNRGDIWSARTTDGGDSWETAHPIFAPRANVFSFGNQIAVQPTGTLVDIFNLLKGSGVQPSTRPQFQAVI